MFATALLTVTKIRTRDGVRRILQGVRTGGGRLRTGTRLVSSRGLRTGASGGLTSPDLSCTRL